jgi:CRISPR-associated protein Cas1
VFSNGHLLPVSQREEVFEYFEYSRIVVEAGVVVAKKEHSGRNWSQNIPAMNISVLLLGPGCSISSESMELLAAANVVVGFTGGGGTPLNAIEDVAFVTGVSEYRPTVYMQAWAEMWFNEQRRMLCARRLLRMRVEAISHFWADSGTDFFKWVQVSKAQRMGNSLVPRDAYANNLTGSTTEELLGKEGAHVRNLYAFHKMMCNVSKDFVRDSSDRSGLNALLTMGNYLAYGLSASALHALGVSFSFPLLHGKTRRGALVFDIADIAKDAIVVPAAFSCFYERGDDRSYFRSYIKDIFCEKKVLSYLVDRVKELSEM